jgi:hypothetical protein
MVDVVAVIGGVAVMLHDESRLAIFQQKLNALILVLGFSEATELKDSPRAYCDIRMGESHDGRVPRQGLPRPDPCVRQGCLHLCRTV